MKSNTDHFISIEVIKGGFVLSYPRGEDTLAQFGLSSSTASFSIQRELFTSERKLTQKLKDVLASLDSPAGTPEPSDPS